MHRFRRCWPQAFLLLALGACLLLAWYLWKVFAPALMSFDSVYQYDEAVTGHYDDGHPPIMAISIAAVRAMGGDLQHLMLLQCMAVVLGVSCLAYECCRRVAGPRLGAVPAAGVALGVLGILLAAWSPFAVYAMTFWKDVWLLACFCWIGALVLNLMRTSARLPTAGGCCKWVACLLVMTLALMVRHNAIVVAPLFGVLLAASFRPVVKARYLAVIALLPWACAWGLKTTIQRVFQVQTVSLVRFPISLDLLTLCATYPEAVDALPYTKQNLTADYRAKYTPGCWGRCMGMARRRYFLDTVQLKNDYYQAITKFPWQLLVAKAASFCVHFQENSSIKFADGLYPFPVRGSMYHFQPDPAYAAVRELRLQQMNDLFRDSPWPFAKHLPWLTIDLAICLVLVGGWWFRRRPAWGRMALLALVPAVYCGSFFLANVAADFRYMYAATLGVQAAVLAALLALAALILKEVAGRLGRLRRPNDQVGSARPTTLASLN
ncbi:MAG: hypothetical protein ABSF26_19050 [Thermoguttaceae bacterium]